MKKIEIENLVGKEFKLRNFDPKNPFSKLSVIAVVLEVKDEYVRYKFDGCGRGWYSKSLKDFLSLYESKLLTITPTITTPTIPTTVKKRMLRLGEGNLILRETKELLEFAKKVL